VDVFGTACNAASFNWLDEFLEAVSQSAINNCSAELMSRGVSFQVSSYLDWRVMT